MSMPFLVLTRNFRAASARIAVVSWLLLQMLAAGNALAYEGISFDAGSKHDLDRALGINTTFGRWNTTVKLVYDPDGAPAQFSTGKMQSLIAEAAAQWGQVCGIQFQLLPADSNAPDDANANFSVNQRDGLVRIFWAKSTGWAGLAGPEFGNYDQNLGYFPYADGDVKLNDDPAAWNNDVNIAMVSTLTHEFGHLIGLGHSENPLSIMYANPYNHLQYPREDDIRAAQVLYGAGSSGVDPAVGVAAWRYTIPAAAPASATQFLFKSPAAFLSLQSASSAAITSINAATADNQFVLINSGGFGGFSNQTAINLNATVVVIDPDGYLWGKLAWNLQCPASNACSGALRGFATTEIMKSYPGTWKILVVDEAAGTLLLTQGLKVVTAPTFNAAPTALVSAVQGSTTAKAIITVAATDLEKQDITVIWHLPGKLSDRNGDGFLDSELSEPLGSDGVAVQTVDFSVANSNSIMFVELKDSGVRYDGSVAGTSVAGDGFSNLLRLTLNMPLSGINGSMTVLAQHNAGDPGTQPVLRSVAATQSYHGVSTAPAGTTTAGFLMGASKDNGLSTATSFKAGDVILTGATVQPQAADLNKAADFFVVLRTIAGGKESWFYRDTTGVYRPWSLVMGDLQPALKTQSLQSAAVVEAYKGPVSAGTFQVFIGYKLSNGSVLHYTNAPLSLAVGN